MAIPPEPVDSVLFDAKAVVVATVQTIEAEGPMPPQVEKKKGFSDLPNKAAWQKVVLAVDDVLLAGLEAKKGGTLTVLKPEGAYALNVGNGGPFLIGAAGDDGVPVILGRHGPDSYRREVVEAALLRRR